MRALVAPLAALSSLATPLLAQEAPPPPEVWAAQVAFFASLPQRYPSKDLSAFEVLVAEDVEVFRDGKLVHQSRRSWIDELQRSPSGASQGTSVSRDLFHRLADEGISVREFSYPIAPEGQHIVYHPHAPLRYVTYYLEKGRLVRVVYGPQMSSAAGLCQAVKEARLKAARPGVDC